MITYNDLIYMIMDELKLFSDDTDFTYAHVEFLLDKYRALLLKQRYSDAKKQVPDSNMQSVTLDLEQVPKYDLDRDQRVFLRSIQEVPKILYISRPKVTPLEIFSGDIAFTSKDRMMYTGYNRFLNSIAYASKDVDKHLYLISRNPDFLQLKKVILSAVFLNADDALNLKDGEDKGDTEFPLEDDLIPNLIDMVVKELLGSVYRPSDEKNNAKDDLSDMANFIASNMKSNFAKKIFG